MPTTDAEKCWIRRRPLAHSRAGYSAGEFQLWVNRPQRNC